MTDDQRDIERRWRRTARSRLKFELAGLALAKKAGMTPEQYADHLWSAGASKWMGKSAPGASEYLMKEAEAFSTLYPEVGFEPGVMSDDRAELTFTGGCLGGWGRDPWATARELGLTNEDVCRYCCRAFQTWAGQVGLDASTEPQDRKCVLRVRRKPR